MAFIESSKWYVSYTFSDNNGKPGSVTFAFPAAMTDAQLDTAAAAIRDTIVPLSDAHLESYIVSKSYRNDAVDPLNASSEVERKLAITFADSTEEFKSSIEVPSPVFTLEISGTDVVDITNAALVAFINAVTNSGAGGATFPVAYSGASLRKVTGSPVFTHRRRKARK